MDTPHENLPDIGEAAKFNDDTIYQVIVVRIGGTDIAIEENRPLRGQEDTTSVFRSRGGYQMPVPNDLGVALKATDLMPVQQAEDGSFFLRMHIEFGIPGADLRHAIINYQAAYTRAVDESFEELKAELTVKREQAQRMLQAAGLPSINSPIQIARESTLAQLNAQTPNPFGTGGPPIIMP